MATYIQGLTDYIPQLQPFQPDYNFLGNILQTRQGRYDAAHKQLNGIYGTVLNSPLLRESNIKRRDEFFKAIDGDIKRISGLDLSLEQNVQQAQQVFKPFFEDKGMINDMTQTKRFYNGLEKHDFLKAAADPNNQAWEEGRLDLLYQAEDFKKMSDKDAMNFQMGSYIPKYNWEKDAVKLATDAGLSVSQDSVTGNWIVHRENGELVQGGLIGLFKSVYGNDQRVIDNYDVKARVTRKQYAKANAMQHGSEEAAEAYYLTSQIAEFNKQQGKTHEDISDAATSVAARKNQLIEKANSPAGLTSQEGNILNAINGVSDSLNNTKAQIEDSIYKVNTNLDEADLAVLRRNGDRAVAQNLMMQDIGMMAYTMSQKGAKIKYEVNPYGMEAFQQKNREKMAWMNFEYDKAKMSIKTRADMELESFKHGLKSGIIPTADASVATLLNNEGLAVAHSEDRSAGVKENTELIASRKSIADNLNASFLYNTFNKAVGYANNNDKGAQLYLKNTFGKDWANIRTQGDMIKAIKNTGRTLETAFDYTTTSLDPNKNPMAATAWAQDYINNGNTKKEIDVIHTKNDAVYATIQQGMKTAKSIVNNLEKMSAVKGNEVFADASLLLTKDGMPMVDDEMPVEFARNYFIKHQHDPGFDPTDYFDDAEKAYEPLRDKFVDIFQTTPGSSLKGGIGLAGGGTTSNPGIKYSNIHSKSGTLDRGAAITTGVLKAVIPNTNSYKAIIGVPTEENISSQGDNEALKGVLAPFFNKAISAGKGNADVIYNAELRPVVGGNKDLSGATVYPPEELIKDFRGTDKKPGILYNYSGQGITMVWNNKELGTPLQHFTEPSDLELIAINGGKKYTAFPNALKDATLSHDETTGQFRWNGSYRVYNEKLGQWTYEPFSIATTQGKVDNVNTAFLDRANAIEKVNLEIEAKLAAIKKAQASQTNR